MTAGKLGFTASEYKVNEKGEWQGLKPGVERVEGTVGQVSVRVANTSSSSLGRGTRNEDYLVPGTGEVLTWADGESGIKYIEFAVKDDFLVEGEESIPLSLGSIQGAEYGTIKSSKVVIIDDDWFIPRHQWQGTALQFQQADGTWGESIELKGDKGNAGLAWKGNWVYGHYEIGDLVSYFDGVDLSVYICTNKPIINYPIGLPPNAYAGYEDYTIFPNVSPYWELFCRGTNGRDGRDYNITYKGQWSPTILYIQRDAVLYQGSSYLCIKENGMGRNPVAEPTFWTLIAKGHNYQDIKYRGPWKNDVNYVPGDAVFQVGNTYLCLQNSIGEMPFISGGSWVLIQHGQLYFTQDGAYGTLQNFLFSCKTSSIAGGKTTFPHGLNLSGIKSYSATLRMSAPVGQFGYAPRILPGGFRTLPGYSYDIAVNNTDIVILTTQQDSSNILDKEVFVTIVT
ncbi:MAG TPA: hypothetical protein V6D21_02725 [Candidatus Obscuribacterales bacterium]